MPEPTPIPTYVLPDTPGTRALIDWMKSAMQSASALAADRKKVINGHKLRSPKAKPEDDKKLCEDAARRWLKQGGADRSDRAVKAVAYVFENNDYDHEYHVGRDKAALIVKRGLSAIGRSHEWKPRAYPKSRKAKLPKTG